MLMRRILGLALTTALLSACSSSTNTPAGVTPVNPVNNSNGTPATGIFTARFDTTAGVLPFPINLLSQGSRDLTINAPIAANAPAGQVALTSALNALDGFSTTSPFTVPFNTPVAAASVVAGQSVRLFQVEIVTSGPLTGMPRPCGAPRVRGQWRSSSWCPRASCPECGSSGQARG